MKYPWPSGRLLPAIALALWAIAIPARADLAARIASVVDPLVEAELTATGAPGAAFVFVHGGRIVVARGYGVSDLASKTKVDLVAHQDNEVRERV